MVYLFVHVIWSVRRREPLLSKPVRRVLFAHLQKEGEEKGIRITAMGGVDDHVHCLLQLLPSQNLLQVLRTVRSSAAAWKGVDGFRRGRAWSGTGGVVF